MDDNQSLRSTFNAAAGDYDAIRPGYPEQVIDDIVALSGISAGGQALEIGCGTGQATLPFARRGYAILCLDIGPDLLAAAARNLRAFPNVRFELTSFEDWPLQPGAFELVYAATAFHWIPHEVGYPKAAQALRPGGALAVFLNAAPRPYTGFAEEVQEVYRSLLPELADARDRQSNETAIARQARWMRASGLFASVEVRTYPWSITYSAAEYIRLLNTYSDHLALAETRRRALYEAIAELAERRYAGRVERPYLTELFLAKTPI